MVTAAYIALGVLLGWGARSIYTVWYRNRIMKLESELLLLELKEQHRDGGPW